MIYTCFAICFSDVKFAKPNIRLGVCENSIRSHSQSALCAEFEMKKSCSFCFGSFSLSISVYTLQLLLAHTGRERLICGTEINQNHVKCTQNTFI